VRRLREAAGERGYKKGSAHLHVVADVHVLVAPHLPHNQSRAIATQHDEETR
jgi:hypothetical protein